MPPQRQTGRAVEMISRELCVPGRLNVIRQGGVDLLIRDKGKMALEGTRNDES